MTDAARRLGMEILASIRMNDTHDAFGKPHGRLDYPLKLEHPEWLLGDESLRGDFVTAPEALTFGRASTSRCRRCVRTGLGGYAAPQSATTSTG